MTHIVMVTTSFPDPSYTPGQEAAGVFVKDFAEELSQHVDVSLIAPSTSPAYEDYGSYGVYRYETTSLPLSLLRPANPSDWPKILKTLRAGQQTLWEVVSKNVEAHILALWALPSGYWARRASMKLGVPYSVWALGSDIWELGRIPFLRPLLKQVLVDGQFRFADGLKLKHDVEALSQQGCLFLPSARNLGPVDSSSSRHEPPYRLAFLGRWHENKGVDLLLESLSMLEGIDWARIAEVRVFGGGPLESFVHGYCSSLQGQGRPVTCGGYLNSSKARDLLCWSDFVLIPSRIESIPVIFSDAMQLRRPVIAQPVGDLPRLMETYGAGVLADDVSSKGFAKAIQVALATSPAKFEAGTLDAATEFSVQHAASSFLKLIETQHE